MITQWYIREWIEKFDPGPTGEDGRTKHAEYTAVRHAEYQNQIKHFIFEQGGCTFNQIWKNIPIKRTTCYKIIQEMVDKGIIKKKKAIMNNRKQHIYFSLLISGTVAEWFNAVTC